MNTSHAASRNGQLCIIILFSIHFVLKAEKALKEEGIEHDVVPVDRAISSDCGMAIEINCRAVDRVAGLLREAGITIARIYRKTGKREFTEIDIRDRL